jgi:hypothetical protein
VVAALTGDRGDSGAPTDFVEGGGDGIRCSERSKGIGGGRGKLSGALEWARRSGMEKKLKGRRGVRRPLKQQAASGSGTWRGEIWGSGQRREGGGAGGSSKIRGRLARAVAGERRSARRGVRR